MFTLALLGIGGAAVAAGCAFASRWEADNEEEEEELERLRERNQRFLRMRRSQLEKNRRKKEIKIELIAREKELKLVRRAEALAKSQLETGRLELKQFSDELSLVNAHSLKLPNEWVEALTTELTSKTKDLKSVHRQCVRHRADVEKRIEELNCKRFYFKCCSRHRKFAVEYGALEKFAKSRKGMRKCCDECFPAVKARAKKKAEKSHSSLFRW